MLTPEQNKREAERKRERYATDPAYRAKHNARNAAWERARRAADPGYRAKRLAWKRAGGPEVAVETALVEGVKLRGGLCPKFTSPGRRGAPDRLVLLPGHPTYYVELKRPRGGVLSMSQERYHADIRRAGQRVWVLKNAQEVGDFFLEIELT